MMADKKAQAHVEVVISFVIFVGFVLFLFFIFNPFKKIANPQLVENVYANIEDKVGIKLTTLSINLKQTIPDDKACFVISGVSKLIKDMKCENEKIVARDDEGRGLNANIDADTIRIQNSQGKRFYTIYCSDEFQYTASLSGCDSVGESEYAVGMVVERDELWSEKKLFELKSEYESSYDNLKKKIMSTKNDFRLEVYEIEGQNFILLFKEPPKGVQVFSEDRAVNTINSQGEIKMRKARIIVW